jgi:hypothetical protein
MSRDADISDLVNMARRLSHLQAVTNEGAAAIGFMLGAVYALLRAAALSYSDARNTAGKLELQAEFARVAAALGSRASPEADWLGGFYFSSALMRIAALDERIGKMAGRKHHRAHKVRSLVNKLKHEPDAHVRGDWDIHFSDVVHAANVLCEELEILVDRVGSASSGVPALPSRVLPRARR